MEGVNVCAMLAPTSCRTLWRVESHTRRKFRQVSKVQVEMLLKSSACNHSVAEGKDS